MKTSKDFIIQRILQFTFRNIKQNKHTSGFYVTVFLPITIDNG